MVYTLIQYLQVTDKLQGNSDTLLITTIRPYKPASRDTISRWIRAFLAKCGIGKEFASYSIRHAATSTASKKRIDIKIIKSLASWLETLKVFNAFYNRPIIANKDSFAHAVLHT